MITPREMLRDYMTVLNILLQNPNACFDDIVGTAVTLKTKADEIDEADVIDEEKINDVNDNVGDNKAKRPAFTLSDLKF